ncbi:MAG: CorA family divalent cation transporter [Halobacteriovoraceae bacterium]|nr:CorA family divalent cation transporter [Halobacteriovoraceae bacterium]
MNYQTLIELVGQQEADFLKEEIERPKPYSSLYTFERESFSGWLLTLRTLRVQDKTLSFDVDYYMFWKKKVYTFSVESSDFDVKPRMWDDFFEEVEDKVDRNRDIFYLYYDETEEIEDRYYQRDFSSALLNSWFELKKETSRMDRFFGRLETSFRDLIRLMEKTYPDHSKDWQYLYREIKGLHENVEGLINRLDNSNNYYTSLKNDRLNKNIYFLTLLSGLFLPLNLIVGFFGMNTEGLFFKENPHGTLNVVYILLGIFSVLLLGSSVVRLVDRIFIKWWLGKTKLHSSIVKKLESFEQNWKA